MWVWVLVCVWAWRVSSLLTSHPLIGHSARAEWLEWRKGWLQTERRLPPLECLIGGVMADKEIEMEMGTVGMEVETEMAIEAIEMVMKDGGWRWRRRWGWRWRWRWRRRWRP